MKPATAYRAEAEPTRTITRFDAHQRIQHILLMVSFTLLALSGLPLKFSDASISQWWVALWGGVETTRTVHRLAAWAMGLDCAYHVLYILFSTLALKRPFPVWAIPSLQDALDFLQDMKYLLGLIPKRPPFGRFKYIEKFDYWAIFWGLPIMAGSGFILMYPVFVTKFLPSQIIPMALVAHSDEAILAVSWVVIVHFFFSHLAPAVFPFNSSIFTGKVLWKRYQREHPLEYDRITAAQESKGGEEASS